jgi:hypothetical protein
MPYVTDEACERCGENLNTRRAVWLELDQNTNLFYKPGALPAGAVSQGGFKFGSACAKKVLAAGGRNERIRHAAK